MIGQSLSFAAERLVPRDRVQHLYSIQGRHQILYTEAKALVLNEHLSAWTPESTALVEALAAQLATDKARIDAFEARIPPLGKAIAVEEEARNEWERAKTARGVGSLKRVEALKLRDDVEHADQTLLVRRRETVECARSASAGLPSSDGVYDGTEARDIVERLANRALRLRFPTESFSGGIEEK